MTCPSGDTHTYGFQLSSHLPSTYCRGRINMSNIILPTTEPVARVCALLDDLVGKFITTYRDTLHLGRYEAEIEALNLFKVAIRNIEGVITLARSDLILLPPA